MYAAIVTFRADVRRPLFLSEEGGVLYRVGFRRDNVLRVSLVTTAAMVAICLLALVETTSTAEAASLPHNGKIVFSSFGSDGGDHDIYTVEPEAPI